ncbi:MAG: tetratricopeptide repeat protein, partial [Steroidobacteraceae bacterium]|nr:tetratricopeptide repeat protein [Steroidobacteraceae bacterium]
EMARMQLALDQLQPARQSAEKAVTLDPDSVVAVGLLAMLDLREKRADSALKLAQGLATRRPADPRAAVLEGDVQLALGRPREAAQAYQRAMALSPNLQIVVKQVAAQRAAGMVNAEAPLALWVAGRPGDVRARQLLAEAYQLAGQRELAVEQYERLTALPAAGYTELNNLAWLYYELGDDRTEAMARRAYDLAPDNPAVIDTYGWVLVEKGKLAEGLQALTRAVKLAPGSPDVRYHHAAALARSGEDRRALTLLDELLQSKSAFASRVAAEQLRHDLASRAPASAN